jgi:hypothetical protein
VLELLRRAVRAEARGRGDDLELTPDVARVQFRSETGAEDEFIVLQGFDKLGPAAALPRCGCRSACCRRDPGAWAYRKPNPLALGLAVLSTPMRPDGR